ncbi:MAG: DEAD/DEAH box helicase [archaeon]
MVSSAHDVEKMVLEANKFPSFNEMQKKCLGKLSKNLVVSAPTASGKTIIAELFILESAMNDKKKIIYTCPLRALASEHYKDFKKKYPELKFALSTGDLDSSSSYLKKFDCIFTTYEKLASLLRHNAEWLVDVGCIIIDEVHELDSDRGPVLEIAITQLRNRNKNIRTLALSATIPNANQLAKWLDAELIESNWRPVKLREGVLFEETLEFNDKTNEEGTLEDVIEKNLDAKKQFLFFMNSRKRAEGMAKRLSEHTTKMIKDKEKLELAKIADDALNVLEAPTEQCSSLADCIRAGAAFHHAGLMGEQREIVEENFRNGKIKMISATPTLAAGVNTPADIVVIPSMYRFEEFGMELISVREYKQMSGRSGRPKFSSEGKSIVIASTENQKELFMEKYINGPMEAVSSQLGTISILRTHILALIATGDIHSIESAEKFFEGTLYAHQLQEMGELIETVAEVVEALKEFNFVVEKEEKWSCTPLGKRVSDLFLDPESANSLVKALGMRKTFTPFSYLFAWVNCTEFSPWFTTPRKLEPLIREEFHDRIIEIPFSEEEALYSSDAQLNKFFSALMLEHWCNEKKEQELFKDYNLAPGVLFGKTRIIEWLSYSTIELSKVLAQERHLTPSIKLGLRAKYGVKEELLMLVELKGIGRVRARKLFNAGIKRPSEIKTNMKKVENILGKKVSDSLAKQLNVEKTKNIAEKLESFKP